MRVHLSTIATARPGSAGRRPGARRRLTGLAGLVAVSLALAACGGGGDGGGGGGGGGGCGDRRCAGPAGPRSAGRAPASCAKTSRSASAACAAVMRSAGSFRSRARRTGSRDGAPGTGGGSSLVTASSVEMASVRSNGGRPVTAVWSVAPNAHRSAGGPGSSPRARSGAM